MSDPARCVILRGGTSKGVYLREADLPSDPAAREQTILKFFDSPWADEAAEMEARAKAIRAKNE